jgi:hypothetical protein
MATYRCQYKGCTYRATTPEELRGHMRKVHGNRMKTTADAALVAGVITYADPMDEMRRFSE